MYRTATSRLRALKGRIGSRFPSSATVGYSSGGFFSWLTRKHTSPLPSLRYPCPGVAVVPPLPDYVEPSKTKMTTLPNGIRIASETSTNPAASIGLYVDCGSVYETPETSGATHLLERMAFKSTRNRSHLRIVREVEAIGGSVEASSSRQLMCYTYDALKTYVPEMTELLIDCVRNPVFLDWEINEELPVVRAEIAELYNDPQRLLMEAIHSTAFTGALTNPHLASESALSRLNGSVLKKFVADNYVAPRMVLAASGVEHEELLSISEPLLSDLPGLTRSEEPKSVYVGGDFRSQANSENVHVTLAFEFCDGLRNEDATTLAVLQMLMGDSDGPFQPSCGPRKGINSKLCNSSRENRDVKSLSAFNMVYNNTGLFVIHVTAGYHLISEAVDLAAKKLFDIAYPDHEHSISYGLERAKESAKSAILMILESRMGSSKDIGQQILTYGKRKSVDEILQAIDRVTVKDITFLIEDMISSPLTMASLGNVLCVPNYDSVSSMFRSK